MLLLCLLLAAQGGAVPRHDVTEYLRLAARYRSQRPGESEAAVDTIRSWSAGEVADVHAALRSNERRLRSGPPLEDGDIDLGLVEAATLLHVEAGLRELQRPNEPDGVVQLAAAGELVRWTDRVVKRGREPALRPRLEPSTLHAMVAAAALAVGFPEIAGAHADEAHRLAPTDASVALTGGCAREGLAHLRELEGAPDEARRLRERAVRSFKDVLALDPALGEARLRLGRLYVEAARYIEAEPLLERVAKEGDARQRYLAFLFLGRAAEKRTDVRRAAELYSRALEAQPDGTAARLALALQLERQAGPRAARTLVIEALGRSKRVDASPDPWSYYLFGRTELAAAELKRVWAEVLPP